jgi:hypothetical protein
MPDELKERNILKLILIVRFACATLDVGHPIICVAYFAFFNDGSLTRGAPVHERLAAPDAARSSSEVTVMTMAGAMPMFVASAVWSVNCRRRSKSGCSGQI